jgi:hypothetical protein
MIRSIMILAGHIACMEEMRNSYRVLAGKSDWNRPLGRRRCGWEDNTKMDLKRNKVEGCQLQSFNSGYRPGTSSCKHSIEPSSSIKGMNFFTGSAFHIFSRTLLYGLYVPTQYSPKKH